MYQVCTHRAPLELFQRLRLSTDTPLASICLSAVLQIHRSSSKTLPRLSQDSPKTLQPLRSTVSPPRFCSRHLSADLQICGSADPQKQPQDSPTLPHTLSRLFTSPLYFLSVYLSICSTAVLQYCRSPIYTSCSIIPNHTINTHTHTHPIYIIHHHISSDTLPYPYVSHQYVSHPYVPHPYVPHHTSIHLSP